MPTEVIDYLAEQLGIADASCLKLYAQREPTHREHARQIQTKLGTALAAAAANPVFTAAVAAATRLHEGTRGPTTPKALGHLSPKLPTFGDPTATPQIRGRACRSWCCCTRSCPAGSAWP
ncbi:DUF4158 domain-containing protein [Nonomuraea sp. NPDC003709]|uniref:DUF4158 domain-containing protein n=1 Tax=Nonomuraea sp. NPDC003709 TaxID=3154450 RepID=UPI00339E8DF8